jgi:hypothetical protein
MEVWEEGSITTVQETSVLASTNTNYGYGTINEEIPETVNLLNSNFTANFAADEGSVINAGRGSTGSSLSGNFTAQYLNCVANGDYSIMNSLGSDSPYVHHCNFYGNTATDGVLDASRDYGFTVESCIFSGTITGADIRCSSVTRKFTVTDCWFSGALPYSSDCNFVSGNQVGVTASLPITHTYRGLLPDSVSDAFALNDPEPDKFALTHAESDKFALTHADSDKFPLTHADSDKFALTDAASDGELDLHTAHSRVKSAEPRSPFRNQRFSFLVRLIFMSRQSMN